MRSAFGETAELEGQIVHLEGDIMTAGSKLTAPDRLVSLFADFFQWNRRRPVRRNNSR